MFVCVWQMVQLQAQPYVTQMECVAFPSPPPGLNLLPPLSLLY